jgi:integrase
MRKRFKTALKAAGVRSIRFHDLRHTFGTRMAAAGAPLRTIQEWMGHRDYKTTESTPTTCPIRSRVLAGPRRLLPRRTTKKMAMQLTMRTRPVRRAGPQAGVS